MSLAVLGNSLRMSWHILYSEFLALGQTETRSASGRKGHPSPGRPSSQQRLHLQHAQAAAVQQAHKHQPTPVLPQQLAHGFAQHMKKTLRVV